MSKHTRSGTPEPGSPSYPQLTTASLFPPPPPNHVHFHPLNLHFHSVLNEHWPTRVDEDEKLLSDVAQPSSSSSLAANPRLALQRRILLHHCSTLASIPPHIVPLCSPPLTDDASVRSAIDTLTSQGIDLKLEMDPPDLDVILDDMRGYNLFGQWWPVPARETGLEEAGLKRLYSDEECTDERGRIDRRPTLLLLLRTLLTSYLRLLSLLQFPPSYYELQTLHTHLDPAAHPTGTGKGTATSTSTTTTTTEWQTLASQTWSHIRLVVINIQEILNRSRADQGRRNVEGLLLGQTRRRREETKRLRTLCQDIRGRIEALKQRRSEEEQTTEPSKGKVDGEKREEGQSGSTVKSINKAQTKAEEAQEEEEEQGRMQID